MTFLLPSEHLDGTTTQRQQLHDLLLGLRTDAPPAPLPGITFQTLAQLLTTSIVDRDLFQSGYELMAARYAELDVCALLPADRVWVGVRSAAVPSLAYAYGGFHHPGQGYRHLQMNATITAYGDLTGHASSPSPQAVTLDLLRAYAHDCLHYGTFRRYRLGPRGQVARVQYGINFRHVDGRTYSAPDLPGTHATRNLGILMEGATDAEATSIARQAADVHGLTAADLPTELAPYALADATGRLSDGDIHTASSAANPYLRSLGGFGRTVTNRYRALLTALAETPGELHQHFVTAMISGDLRDLHAWLDARHGPGTFTRRFRAPIYDQPVSRPAA